MKEYPIYTVIDPEGQPVLEVVSNYESEAINAVMAATSRSWESLEEEGFKTAWGYLQLNTEEPWKN